MTKRIFRSLVLTAALSVLLAAVLLAVNLFGVYEDDLIGELRDEAKQISYALSRESSELDYFQDLSSYNRITLVRADGTVLYDNLTDPALMNNHAGREEIASALQDGWGESRRYSDTLAETTYYFALRTGSGNVLRLANTRSSVWSMFLQTLPLMAVILAVVAVFSLFFARFTARRIVAPVNSLNLDAPLENRIYDEFTPLLSRMDRQRREIECQMQELDNVRRELTAITENMREGMVLLDSRGAILTINPSAAEIFGLHLRDSIGLDMLEAVNDDSVRSAVRMAQDGAETDVLMPRGARQYRLLANPVSSAGRPTGIVLLALDVTARYAAEISRKQFTANVSHELKTPLTSISGYAEIIHNGMARPEDVQGFAARILSESRHLLALINDILELSRLDERRGLGERAETDLTTIARNVVRRLEPRAADKGITIAVEGGSAVISAYPLLIGEMVYNLADNAVKYTPSGGSVLVRTEVQVDAVLLSVRDTGVGIPAEHHEHIFERFYRVDKSHSRATGGTGLGLSIVKNGADVHGAAISLESHEGRGTCIQLRFPKA